MCPIVALHSLPFLSLAGKYFISRDRMPISILLLYQNKEGKYVIREHTSKTMNPILFTVAEWTVEIFQRRKEL